MSKIITMTGQTAIDIAIQELGSVSGVIDLLRLNPTLKADGQIGAGTIIKLPKIINTTVVRLFSDNQIKPVSSIDYDIEAHLNLINTGMATQVLNHVITSGEKYFPSVRVYNLYKNLTIQIDYNISSPVKVSVEQSLDNEDFSPIPTAWFDLHTTENTHTFNIVNLLTNYVRVKVEAAGAYGTINEIMYKV